MGNRFRKTKRCAFCLKNADSVEHAWPDWTLKRFRGKGSGIRANLNGLKYFDPAQRALKFRCVCRVDCNNGWMKRLEDAVLPTAGSMMSDISFILDIPQQRTLAQWAVKTSMVFEYCYDTAPPFYSDNERFALKQPSPSPSIPASTAVWIGRNGGGDTFFTALHTFDGFAPLKKTNRPIILKGHITTILLARLVLQVVTIHPDEPYRTPIPESANPSLWRDSHTLIWPSQRAVPWPPPRSIAPGAIMRFHTRFLK